MHLSPEEIIFRVLLQLVAILVVSRLVVVLLRRVGQTDVGGEILAGILLGPSLLGALWPDGLAMLFPASTTPVMTGLAQLGLIFLMFEVGLEFEFSRQLGRDKRTVVLVSLLGIVVPFALGLLSASWFHARLPGPEVPLLGFQLFFATAMAITAIPVLGRIFMELGLSGTRIAALVIGSAAIDDVIGWLCLGVVSSLVAGHFAPEAFVLRILGLAAFVVLMLFVAGPPLRRAVNGLVGETGSLERRSLAPLLIVVLLSSAVTSFLGVFAIIGAFILGLTLHTERRFVAAWKAQVAPLAGTLLLPVFFMHTGLRTHIGSLDARLWGMCALVVAIAFVGKYAGAYAGARLAGERPLAAFTIGTCMNTRALMELVVLNIGFEMGVLPPAMFTMLVIMALASTFMATPLIRWSMRTLMEEERRGNEDGDADHRRGAGRAPAGVLPAEVGA